MDRRTNVRMTENFDVNLFNRIYAENKISTPFDDGYGDWMKKTESPKLHKKNYLVETLIKIYLITSLRNIKKINKKSGNQMVIYETPEVGISYKGKDSIVTLGQSKVNDFSGDTGSGLNFRDYRDAYTNSCLIDVHQFKDKGRPKDINSMESNRSNISYEMSEQDKKDIYNNN